MQQACCMSIGQRVIRLAGSKGEALSREGSRTALRDETNDKKAPYEGVRVKLSRLYSGRSVQKGGKETDFPVREKDVDRV